MQAEFLCLLCFSVTCLGYCSVSTISGMNTADCNNRSLRAVPGTLRDDLKVFKINDNKLTDVGSNSFKMYPLLSEIHMGRNRIAAVSPDAFRGLSRLKLLDMSDNLLSVVPTEALRIVQTLTVLVLKGNLIAALGPNCMDKLSLLLEVNLENCSIAEISTDAFRGLPRLTEINLAGNRLETMAESSLEPVRRSLSVLHLGRNPWRCDCHLRWLRVWLETHSAVWKNSRQSPTCHDGSPHVKKMTWTRLEAFMFACPIKVISVGKTTVEAKTGEDVTFECVVHSDPGPKVYWRRKEGTPLPADFKVTENHLWTDSTHESRLLTSLTISNVSQSSMGYFVCVAENNVTQSELVFRLAPQQQQRLTSSSSSSSRQGSGTRLRDSDEQTEEILKQKIIVVVLLGLGVVSVVCLSLATLVLSQKFRRSNSYKVTGSEVDLPAKSLSESARTNTLLSQLTSPAKVNSSLREAIGSSIKRSIDECSPPPPHPSHPPPPIGVRSSVTAVNHAVPFYAVLPSVDAQRSRPTAALAAGFDPTLSHKTIPRNGYKTFSD